MNRYSSIDQMNPGDFFDKKESSFGTKIICKVNWCKIIKQFRVSNEMLLLFSDRVPTSGTNHFFLLANRAKHQNLSQAIGITSTYIQQTASAELVPNIDMRCNLRDRSPKQLAVEWVLSIPLLVEAERQKPVVPSLTLPPLLLLCFFVAFSWFPVSFSSCSLLYIIKCSVLTRVSFSIWHIY